MIFAAKTELVLLTIRKGQLMEEDERVVIVEEIRVRVIWCSRGDWD